MVPEPPERRKKKKAPGRRKKKRTLKLGTRVISNVLKPVRIDVFESLQVAGPASISELASRLGRPADSLYYHVHKLVSAGVIEELDETRGHEGPGRKGAVYSVAAERLDVHLDPGSRHSRDAWVEGSASVLRLAQRDFAKTLDSGDPRPTGSRRNLVIRRIKMRLNSAQLREVNEMLENLYERCWEHARNPEGDLHALTFVMTPLEESQR